MDETIQRRIRLAIEETAKSSGVAVRDLSISQVDLAIRRALSPDELGQVSLGGLFGIWKRLVDEEE